MDPVDPTCAAISKQGILCNHKQLIQFLVNQCKSISDTPSQIPNIPMSAPFPAPEGVVSPSFLQGKLATPSSLRRNINDIFLPTNVFIAGILTISSLFAQINQKAPPAGKSSNMGGRISNSF